jgi:hypothetical protein
VNTVDSDRLLEQLAYLLRQGRQLQTALIQLDGLPDGERTEAIKAVQRTARRIFVTAEEVAGVARHLK